jgi:hypothetical protein
MSSTTATYRTWRIGALPSLVILDLKLTRFIFPQAIGTIGPLAITLQQS